MAEIPILSEESIRKLAVALKAAELRLKNLERNLARGLYPRNVWVPGGGGAIVFISHGDPAGSQDVVEANDDGFHKGTIGEWDGEGFETGDDVWILFAEDFIEFEGQRLAVNGNYYHAFDSGTTVTSEGETRSLYIVGASEQRFLCKSASQIAKGDTGTVDVYHSHNQADSGIDFEDALALATAIEADKWTWLVRSAGVWFLEEYECPEDEEQDYA